jgi:integrase
MATVIRRGGSKIWTALFRDHRGVRYCLSTKETDKRLALLIAQEWEQAAWKIRSKLQTQRVIDRLHEKITGERIARVSLREYADIWLRLKKHETKPGTLAFYRQSVTSALAFFKLRADWPLTELRREDVLGYRTHLADRLAPKTANHHLKCLKMILRAAKHEGLLADDPGDGIAGVKQRTEALSAISRRPFTFEEVRSVLAVCDPEWRSMVLFSLYLGLRLADVASLPLSAIDRQRGTIRLTIGKTGQTPPPLPLAPALLRHIDNFALDDDGPIHPRAWAIVTKSGGRVSQLSNSFSDILAKAGLRERAPHHKSQGKGRSGRRTASALSFHSLRHTCTSWLHDSGVHQSLAMCFVGHASPEIHQHYARVSDQSLRDTAKALPDVTAQLSFEKALHSLGSAC